MLPILVPTPAWLMPDRPGHTSRECLRDAFPVCLVWVSRLGVPVLLSVCVVPWGECLRPGSAVLGASGRQSRQFPPSSFPGCLASPCGRPTAARTASRVTTVGADGLPGRFHVERLGRCAFAAGTYAALACARATGSSPHSSLLTVPGFLGCDSCLFSPSDRACVSLVASQAILRATRLRSGHLLERIDHHSRAKPLVPSFRLSVLRCRRLCLSAGFHGGDCWSG